MLALNNTRGPFYTSQLNVPQTSTSQTTPSIASLQPKKPVMSGQETQSSEGNALASRSNKRSASPIRQIFTQNINDACENMKLFNKKKIRIHNNQRRLDDYIQSFVSVSSFIPYNINPLSLPLLTFEQLMNIVTFEQLMNIKKLHLIYIMLQLGFKELPPGISYEELPNFLLTELKKRNKALEEERDKIMEAQAPGIPAMQDAENPNALSPVSSTASSFESSRSFAEVDNFFL